MLQQLLLMMMMIMTILMSVTQNEADYDYYNHANAESMIWPLGCVIDASCCALRPLNSNLQCVGFFFFFSFFFRTPAVDTTSPGNGNLFFLFFFFQSALTPELRMELVLSCTYFLYSAREQEDLAATQTHKDNIETVLWKLQNQSQRSPVHYSPVRRAHSLLLTLI